MNTDTFKQLLKEKKLKEAGVELERLLNIKPSPEEEAEATVKVLRLSMELDNLLAEEEIALLKTANTKLAELNKADRTVQEQTELETAKKTLKE